MAVSLIRGILEMLAALALRPANDAEDAHNDVETITEARAFGRGVVHHANRVTALLLTLGALLATGPAAAVTALERQALDALYASTNGAGWTNSTGWNGAIANECQWFGVQCSDPDGLGGNVIAIRLSGNNLTGTLPDAAQWAKLDQINVIELRNNRIGGTIPSIAALTRLNTLDLSINQFTGTIPALSGNVLLGAVSFAENQLTGSIPGLTGLTALRGFDVSNNQLTGPIPSLAGLNALVGFSVKQNALTGSIPSLAGLTLLEVFFAYENQLTGPIPSLTGLASLQRFLVYSNQLTGSVPSLTGLANLTQFAAYDNQLDGTIGALTGATNLGLYLLYNNKLTGSIPSLAGLSNLQFFQVEDNQLTGTLPSLAGLSKIVFFQVERNQLTGPIPSLAGLTTLVRFGASNNQLTGPLPSLAGLTSLGRFVVFRNQLTGTIPSLAGLNNLIQFEVAQNQLSGTLPAIDTLPALEQFIVSGNQFTGPIPAAPPALIANGSDLRYNALTANGNAQDTAKWNAANFNGNDWQSTQTVAPTNVTATAVGTTVNVSWTPIAYTGDSGGYEVMRSTTPGGPYSLAGSTASKSASTLAIANLAPNTQHYFVVVTRTDPHVISPDPQATSNANTVRSANSAEVSATTTNALAATTTTLTSSGSPTSQGTTITFTATVTGGSAPTGSITFKVGASTLGTASLQFVGGAYKASITANNLATGTYSLTASYSGDAANAPSTSAPISQVVGPIATSVSGMTATGTGAASASFTLVSGGPGSVNCGFDETNTGFVAAPASQPAPGSTQPHGQFRFTLANCGPVPTTVRMSVTWPSLAGAAYFKYGRIATSAGQPVWYQPANLVINGNTASFDVTDGDLGDDDLQINGTIIDPSGPVIVPAAPAGSSVASEISNNFGGHTCARTATNGFKCWGLNSSAELGDGTKTPRSAPVDVQGVPAGTAAIQATRNGTCLISGTGGLKCFGNNGSGQLGDGTHTERTTPTDVSGYPSGAVSVASTQNSKCVLSSSGQVKCMGPTLTGPLVFNDTPAAVPGLTDPVMQLSGGFTFMCALTTAGGVKCWGANNRNQLGDGTTNASATPVDVAGLSSGVSAIAAGGEHVCALIAATGGLKCWGYNASGQTGDGGSTATNRPTPVDVQGLTSGVVAVSGGVGHTCAVTDTGAVKCWGQSQFFGQVGDGQFANRNAPVQVSGLLTGYVDTIAGANISCARSALGAVKCWGLNDSFNGIGDGTTQTSATPKDVVGINGGNHVLTGFNVPGRPSMPLVKAAGTSMTLTALSSAGRPVTFSTYTPDRCTVTGNQVQFIANGLCMVRASASGDAVFSAAADLTRLIVVGGVAPAITVAPATLPSAIVGTPYTQNLTASGGTAPYVFTITAGSLPAGLSLAPDGTLAGTPTASGTFNFTVTATDGTAATGTRPYSLLVSPVAPVLRTLTVGRSGAGSGTVTSTPAGIQCGSSCSADFADGTPVTLGVAAASGSVFAGWSGACSGTGACVVTMTAAQSVGAQFNLAPVPLVLPPATLPFAVLNSAYQFQFAATGGTPPYRYGMTGGALPAGLSIDPHTGLLSGVPTQPGTFTFQVTATDNAVSSMAGGGLKATAASVTQTYSLTVIAVGTAIPALSPNGLGMMAFAMLLIGALSLRRSRHRPLWPPLWPRLRARPRPRLRHTKH